MKKVTVPVRWRPPHFQDPSKNVGRKLYLKGEAVLDLGGSTKFNLGLRSMNILRRPKAELAHISEVVREDFTHYFSQKFDAFYIIEVAGVIRRNEMFVIFHAPGLYSDHAINEICEWIYFTLRKIDQTIKDWE